MSELMQQKKDGLMQERQQELAKEQNKPQQVAETQKTANSSNVQAAIGSAVVTADALNVRSGPSVAHSKIGLLRKAAKVEVLSEKDGWLQVSYDGEIAYISAAYTSFARNNAAAPTIESIGSAQITAKALNVRTGPGTAYGKVGLLKESDNVKVYGEKDGWLEIRIDGKIGYISAQYASYNKKGDEKKAEDEDKKEEVKEEQQATKPEEKKEETPKKEETKEEDAAEHGSVIDKATVTVSSLNVRTAANANSTKLDMVSMGHSFDVIGKEGEWLKVIHKDGVAFVHGRYTMLQSKMPKPLAPLDFSAAGPELKALFDKERLTVDEIKQARDLIKELPEEKQGDFYEILQSKNYYHSQRDNRSTEGGKNIGDVMCNLTSLAMCLEQLGVPNPYPEMQYEDALEKIRRDNKYAARTTAAGWGAVASKMGVSTEWLLNPGTTSARPQEFWTGQVREALRSGKAVMGSVHGHIIRFQQVTDQGVIVDDPFGAMKLLSGKSRSWVKTNDKKSSESQIGEDHLIPFEELSVHWMHWLVAFS